MFNFLTKLSNLQQRLIVGILGAVIIIAGICCNQWSYFVLFLFINLFSLLEFHSLVKSAGIKANKWYGVFLGLVLFIGSFLIVAGYLKSSFYIFFFALLFILFLIELFQVNDKPFERTAFAFLAIVYTALPYSLLNTIVFKNGEYNFKIACQTTEKQSE